MIILQSSQRKLNENIKNSDHLSDSCRFYSFQFVPVLLIYAFKASNAKVYVYYRDYDVLNEIFGLLSNTPKIQIFF